MKLIDTMRPSSTCIKMLAYGVVILFAVAPATLYFYNELRHIDDESMQYSQLLSGRLRLAIAENPQLWQYAVPKFTDDTQQRKWFPYIMEVAVYDREFRLIHRGELIQPLPMTFLSRRYDLRYKGELHGTVQVTNGLDTVLLWSALLLLFGCAGVGVLMYANYDYSVRRIQQAEHERHQAIANLIQANNSLENMSIHDVTTGAYTISYVSKILLETFAKPGGSVSALLVDIDFFRYYNDLHGHENGNAVLRTIAELLQRHLRDRDCVGRFGGEEFIVVLPEIGIHQAVKVAERIRVAVESHDFHGAELQPKGRLTVSIGVSSTETAATFQEMFRQLDDAIYRAKSAGRNYSCAFSLPAIGDEPISLATKSPEMKAEVTRKFISHFFQSADELTPQLREPAILAFLKALEIWDPITIQHSLRVNRIAMEIATAMKLPKSDSLTLNLGSLLHDIGKLTIGDTILVKPGRLTKDEYELMKNHSRVGYELVKNDPVLHKAADIVLLHHERFDGTGYPMKLAGIQIPLLARICIVADAMDAMMNDRSYSQGKSIEDARREVIKNKGSQFDPEIVDTVLTLDWQCFRTASLTQAGLNAEKNGTGACMIPS